VKIGAPTNAGYFLRWLLACLAILAASTSVSSGAGQNPKEDAVPETQKGVSSSNNAPKTHPPREFNTAVTGGRGLVRAASPYTLASGELVASAHVVNFDRNPGDIDFFDFPLRSSGCVPSTRCS
jgi:hypothetical protein